MKGDDIWDGCELGMKERKIFYDGFELKGVSTHGGHVLDVDWLLPCA